MKFMVLENIKQIYLYIIIIKKMFDRKKEKLDNQVEKAGKFILVRLRMMHMDDKNTLIKL
jgi:hypothetical protein